MKKTKEESKNYILDVFKDLLYEKGYGKVTLGDISQKGNISPSLVNYHFTSIANLYQEVWWQHFENVHSVLSSIEFDDKITELFTYDILIQNALYQNKSNVDYFASVYRSKPISLYTELHSDSDRMFADKMFKSIIMKKGIYVNDYIFSMMRAGAAAVKKEMFMRYLDNPSDVLDNFDAFIKDICFVANSPILYYIGHPIDEIKEHLDKASELAGQFDTKGLLILGK